ncbi:MULTISPECIES: NUDIX domain-containing protein [unclassified Streptomyces]|uniref:NUDIX domain-containing protein n=1 Tax=unclassified Streptomyces TaxID=2593676 RepID=UPI002F9196D6
MSEHPQLLTACVAQVLLHANGSALCVRGKPGAALAQGRLTVLGGRLQDGEPLDRAARRETEKATGVRVSPTHQEFCGLLHHHAPGRTDQITAVFVAQSWTGEPNNAEPHKHQGLFWVSMENPPPDCHPDTTAIFQTLTEGPSYRALNWISPGGSL